MVKSTAKPRLASSKVSFLDILSPGKSARLLQYRIAGFVSGIFTPMRTPKRGFT